VDNKDLSKATAGKILVVPFDGEKFDADSGGTKVITVSNRDKSRSCIAVRDIGPGIVEGTARKETVDLSGRLIKNNSMPRSGIYFVKTADGRRIKTYFNFGNGR
jgi:hypothetical protein